MVARGGLGYPWIFEELTGTRSAPPSDADVLDELRWVLERGEEHWGPVRAARNLRKFYPWYLDRLGIHGADARRFPADQRRWTRSGASWMPSRPGNPCLFRREIAPLYFRACPTPCARRHVELGRFFSCLTQEEEVGGRGS